jgi:hypothetical protein
MQRNLVDAASGNKTTAAAFNQLHLSVSQLVNEKPDVAFKQITSALGGIGNAAERTRLAMQIFGRSGTDVLQLLHTNFKEAGAEADRFGLTITRYDASALHEVDVAVAKIGDASDGAARQFAVGLAPAISNAIEKIMSAVNWSDAFRKAGVGAGFFVAQAFDTVRASTDLVALAVLKLTEYYYDLKAVKDAMFNKNEIDADAAMVDALNKEKDGLEKEISDLNAGRTGQVNDFIKSTGQLIQKNTQLAGSYKNTAANIQLSQKAMEEHNKAIKTAMENVQKYNDKTADTFISMKDSFLSAGSVLDGFKKIALDAVTQIANSMIKLSFGGSPTEGLFGSIASSLMGNSGGALGGGSGFYGMTTDATSALRKLIGEHV